MVLRKNFNIPKITNKIFEVENCTRRAELKLNTEVLRELDLNQDFLAHSPESSLMIQASWSFEVFLNRLIKSREFFAMPFMNFFHIIQYGFCFFAGL